MKNIVFMGTPDFAVPILEALIKDESINIQAVVTQPDRKVGRKKVLTAPPVKQKAVEHDLLVLQPEKIAQSEELDQLLAMDIDLIITAAFGQFLPTALLDHPTYKSINVHASLLPKYRGAAPIHYAVWNGDEETGITIMYMSKQMDAGDMLAQQSLPIEESDDMGILFDKLSIVGRDLLMKTLPALFNGELTPIKQDEAEVSYSPMISKEQEAIDWTNSATTLFNKVRAFRPFPGNYTLLDGKRFKMWDTKVVSKKTTKEPGTIVQVDKETLEVACGDNTVLSLLVVQPAGKPKMPVESYLKGANLEVGMKFGE